MTTNHLARRVCAVSAAFVLACGASGVAASAAFADDVPASSTATIANDEQPVTFVSSPTASGSFSLIITIAGTAINVSYAVNADGAVVSAAVTSTSGGSLSVVGPVAVHENELSITLKDGQVVSVELGNKGDVKEVSVEGPDNEQADDNQGDSAQGDNNHGEHTSAVTSTEGSTSGDEHHGDGAASTTAPAATEGDNHQGDDNQGDATPTKPATPKQSDSSHDGGGDSGDSGDSGGSSSGGSD